MGKSAVYWDKGDLVVLGLLMLDITEGRASRNKNFYSLTNKRERRRFKRAKLLLSLSNDLIEASQIPGNQIGTHCTGDIVEVFLHVPTLKYRRQVWISKGELDLIRQKTKIALN